MAAQIPVAKQQEIARLRKAGKTWPEIARKVGLHRTTCLSYANGPTPAAVLREANREPKAKPSAEPERTDDVRKDSQEITLRGTRICTLDQMIAHCKIDLDLWEVERFLCNKWEVGAADKSGGKLLAIRVEPLFQVKVWLKRRKEIVALKEAVERFIARAEKCAPKFPHIVRMRSKDSTGVWIEPSLYDHHFGAYIWEKETGHASYDLPIAKKLWGEALSCHLDRMEAYKPEGAVFPVGNDQQNADNRAGTTEAGTPQNNDSRYEKVFDVSVEATKWAIDQMVARGLRVHVPVVRGNHDPLSAWHLGRELEIWYRNNPRVTIDNKPTPRKWWEHGVNMLMFTHGHKVKLEELLRKMAAEQPAMWGRTLVHEAHTGHIHQRRLIEFEMGVARSLPSLRPVCAWAAELGLLAVRASECLAWSATEGLIGNSTHFILPGQVATAK